MEFLVTGGGGFIGSNIVHELLAQGRRVRVLDDFSTGRRSNLADVMADVEVIEGDLRNVAVVAKAMRKVRYVLHVGARSSVIRSVQDPIATNSINIDGTLNVLMQARDAGVERVVFSSSSSVYGNTPVLPKVEHMSPTPLSPYAISKLAGEHYCRVFNNLYGVETVSLRYFNVFGPRQDPASHYSAVIPRFIAALAADHRPTIYGDGNQTRDFTFVDDVVRANLAACTAPRASTGQVYNAARGNRISVNALAKRLCEIIGKSIEPKHLEARAGDVADSQADASLAAERLNWKAEVLFEEGLRRTVEWFLHHEMEAEVVASR